MSQPRDRQPRKCDLVAVEILCDIFPGRRRERLVLQVGMAAGHFAEQLLNNGFYLVDVADPASSQDVGADKRRSLYDRHYCCDVNNDPLPIPTGTYDIVVSMEAFCDRHSPCGVLPELARVCKPGGIVLIAVEKNHLYTNDEYLSRMQSMMIDLQTEDLWDLLVREIVPDFPDGDDRAPVIYVFKTCGGELTK